MRATVISDTTSDTTTNRYATFEECIVSYNRKAPRSRKSGLSGCLEAKFLSSAGEVMETSTDASDVVDAPSVDLL